MIPAMFCSKYMAGTKMTSCLLMNYPSLGSFKKWCVKGSKADDKEISKILSLNIHDGLYGPFPFFSRLAEVA